LSIGMTNRQSTQFILFPQSLLCMTPPLTNEVITLVKSSSLLSVISITELTRSAQSIIAERFVPFELCGAGGTLLRCVDRIEITSEVKVLLEDVNMAGQCRDGKLIPDTPAVTARKRRQFGMVFQRFNQFAHLTALDNVATGPHRVLGMESVNARTVAAEQLDRVKLSGHMMKRPAQLSGGSNSAWRTPAR
jgi:ABC-type proline/glycine betaine transport system ATPase subunit